MTHQVESEATKYSDRQRKLLTPFEFYPKYYCPKHYVKQGSWKSIFWWSIWTKKYPNYLAWTPPIDSTYFHSILRCTCGAMPLNIMVIYQTLSTFLQGVRVWCKNPKIFRALTRLLLIVHRYIERRTSFVFMSSYRVACKNVFIIGSRFHVVGVSEGGQGKVDVRVGG